VAQRERNAWRIVGASIVALFLSCSRDSTGPDTSRASPDSLYGFVVSSPVPASAAGVASRASAATAATGDSVIYVSLPPGSAPTGRLALVRDLATGQSVTAPLFAGGFDPVAIGARVGDSVQMTVHDDQGALTLGRTLAVTAARPPVVVRTEPPDKKTDVPINAAVIVVFSEPISVPTLSTTSLQLLRGSTPIAGSARFADSSHVVAEFVPAAQLAPITEYRLAVSTAIQDVSGRALESAVTAAFTTGNGLTGPVASLTVTPFAATVPVGWTVWLTATPRDAAGNALDDSRVTWSGPNRATSLSASGAVQAVAPGTDTVTATLADVSTTAVISVGDHDISGIWDFTRSATDPSGNAVDSQEGSYDFSQRIVQSVRVGDDLGAWDPEPIYDLQSSGNGGFTFFSAERWVRELGLGYCAYEAITVSGAPPARISGQWGCTGGAHGTWEAARPGRMASLTIYHTPIWGTVGDSIRQIAELHDSAGRRVFLRPVALSSDHPAVAAVPPSAHPGMWWTTAVRDTGTATITAAAVGLSATGQVTGGMGGLSVSVTPAADTILPGATVQLTATVVDDAGGPIRGLPVVWLSLNPTVATVTNSGSATAVAAGTTTIVAYVENWSGATTLAVSGPPLDFGGEWRFAEVWYGGNYDESPYYLCSDTGSVTFIQNGPTFTGSASRAGDCLDETPMLVSEGVVNGSRLSFLMGCRYTAAVTGAGADLMSGRAVDCPDSNTWVMSFQAVRVGSTASVIVQPSATTLLPGATAQLTAVVRDAAGDELSGLPIEWVSDDPAVATVSPSGLVAGVASGTATITATADGRGGTAAITVATVSFSSVSPGNRQTCAVATDGNPYCWGAGRLWPARVPDELALAAATTGGSHTCWVSAAGAAYCRGGNEVGQLGDGSHTGHDALAAVAGGLTFTSLSAGWDNTCGTAGETAYCWGANWLGQLGTGSDNGPGWCNGIACSTTPAAVAGGLAFASVSAGAVHSCGVTTGGAAYCWGRNYSGDLGTGSATGPQSCSGYACSTVPAAVVGWLVFASVSAGGAHSCGIASHGAVYCWGNNASGQLGTGAWSGPEVCDGYGCSTRPVAVAGGLRFAAVSAGAGHTCGLTADGVAYCWGDNRFGQLGTGSAGGPDHCWVDATPTPYFPCSTRPVAVSGGLTFASISAGDEHTCGVTTSGVTYCWGANQQGELGNGTTTGSTVPIKVAGQP
jgi:alpha-tubulin suppressor-like RCC1 family protein/uncharacterized protein YjdB